MIGFILVAVSWLVIGFSVGFAVGASDPTRFLLVFIEASLVGFAAAHIYHGLQTRRIRRQVERLMWEKFDAGEMDFVLASEKRGRDDPAPSDP